jgi:hypothetical protein
MRMIVVALATLLSLSSCTTTVPTRYNNTVQKLAQEVIEEMNFQKPYPVIEVVSSSHWSLEGRHAQASASLDMEGKGWIYIKTSTMLNQDRFVRGLLLHEFSHLQAWRDYGIHVPMHGAQFQDICRKYGTRKECKSIFD